MRMTLWAMIAAMTSAMIGICLLPYCEQSITQIGVWCELNPLLHLCYILIMRRGFFNCSGGRPALRPGVAFHSNSHVRFYDSETPKPYRNQIYFGLAMAEHLNCCGN